MFKKIGLGALRPLYIPWGARFCMGREFLWIPTRMPIFSFLAQLLSEIQTVSQSEGPEPPLGVIVGVENGAVGFPG